MKNVIVVGGGPAGMMAADAAAEGGAQVTLIEQNSILGKKLLITGKGRCNVTNFSDENDLISQVISNPKFLYSAFAAFNAYDAYAYFEESGVPLKIERGNRVFPESDRAADVRNALLQNIKNKKVKIVHDRVVSIQNNPFLVRCENGDYSCDSLIIATGGVSYPSTGSKGDGHRFAKQLGHRLVPCRPALVPLIEDGRSCVNMAGLSLKNVQLIIVNAKGKEVFSQFGEMLFTHEGISGPLVLSASSFLSDDDFPCKGLIDLKPALDQEMLDKRICRDFEMFTNRDFRNALGKLLPQKIIPEIIKKCDIDPETKVHQITREQRLKLVDIIKNFQVKLSKKSDFFEAIITAGGVDIRDIDPRTMESRVISNLYFAGEILDVDALTGGYNLQIAYSTGRLAGIQASKEN